MNKLLCAVSLLATALPVPVFCCTGVSLYTSDNNLVQARTIEWGESSLNSKLIVSPAGNIYTSIMPDSTDGLTWTAKYGFVGISVSLDNIVGEGINEKGLTAGVFYFKGYGSLAKFDKNDTSNNIVDMDFVRWMLTNFSTVDEVLAELPKIKIVPIFISPDGVPSPTGHWRVADKSGRNIVIEIVNNGEIQVFENIGVLTNSPGYEWQVTNLNNYINIQPGTIATRNFGKHVAKAFGAGTGSLGLPGDITPPSRFVRAAFYLFSTPVRQTTIDAVSDAFHILDNFDIPIGSEFAPDQQEHIPSIPSATQWTSVIDLSTLTYYYKTMYNSTVKSVNVVNALNKISKKETYLPLDNGKFNYEEVVF